MTRMIKNLPLAFLLMLAINTQSQNRKVVYHPCFLMDSVDKRLDFIVKNAPRIFVDSFDCRQTLMDSIAIRYVDTKDTKYLNALAAIRQNPLAKVENLYTDIIKRFVENDFAGFVEQLYAAKGKLLPLQNELISGMNMIIDGKLLKQKYMGLLNVEIAKAKDANDKLKFSYFEKLKLKIEEEKF
ncbi:MAG: hypothetical protein JWO06_1216 [Bacteroidota bacterium]|nr:hypothetical protein [Bacteroidota bacterium]